MQFEWDEVKNIENIRKHKIDFSDVKQMFNNPMLMELDQRYNYWLFKTNNSSCSLDRKKRQYYSYYFR